MVSVVVETITAREHDGHGPLIDAIAPTLAALLAQRPALAPVEHLVVLDDACAEDAAVLAARFPSVRVVTARASNYFAAKNAGVEAASGDIVALIDGDCLPEPDWLAQLTHALAPGIDVVAGRTRYEGGSLAARTFSVPDFAHVLATGDGASGFNINNVAYRREVYLAEPLDERIRRNGGCFFQYHALRRRGAHIAYAPDAVVSHGLDVGGLGFVRKHFDRGYDGTGVYRLDARRVLRGSGLVQRFGPLALVALAARRVGTDWVRLTRHRRQMQVPTLALPYYFSVATLTRGIELTGALAAWLGPAAVPRPLDGGR
jgi:glycosyltransferase involved in cell wall biosynthesis